MKPPMHVTAIITPRQAATPKSMPWSRIRMNSAGPVNHGSPIRMPPTVGPHQRAASATPATSSGVTAILRRNSIGGRVQGLGFRD